MNDQIKEHILKLSGEVSLPISLEYKRYMAGVEFEISKIEKEDLKDGSFNFVYKGKLTGNCVITKENKKVYGQGKKSQSSRLRAAIWTIHRENDIEEEFDLYYNRSMGHIRNLLNDILNSMPEVK